MKRFLAFSLATFLLLALLFLTGCKKDVEINYEQFRQSIQSTSVSKASFVNEQASGKNYVLVFVTVENEMKDAVIVRKGDYSLTVNGEEIASEGYVTKVDLQSGTPGSNRLYTSDYETVPKKDTRTLGIIFFCDAEEGADYTLRFHDRVISQ